MKFATLAFSRFHTPHTCRAPNVLSKEVIEHWGLTEHVKAITTDNTSDLVLVMSFLHDWLSEEHPMTYEHSSQYPISCFAHILNFATKERMKDIHSRF